MKKTLKKITLFHLIEYLAIIFGCFVISTSFNMFLYPNNIASGGVPGLSIILCRLLGLNVIYIQLIINVLLFLIGLFIYGSNFALKTLVSSFCIPFFIFLTQGFAVLNINIFFASILGGIGVAIGLVFILRSCGSAGGFTLLAQIIHYYTNIKLSSLILILNIVIIFLAGLIFGFSGAVYAILSIIITSFSIDGIMFCLNKYEKK